MLIAVCGGHGSPGVTTTALGLAASWPVRPVVLAELDAAGAVLPYRVRGEDGDPLSLEAGVVSWAAASRTGVGAPLWPHLQRIDGGLPVLVGPRGAAQAVAVGATWPVLAAALAGWSAGDVVADVGRLLTASAVNGSVVAAADLVVLVAAASLEGAAALRTTLEVVAALRAGRPLGGLVGVHVVVVDARSRSRLGRGRSSRGVAEVLAAVPGLADVPVAGVVPWDPATAQSWTFGGHRPGPPALLRACEELGKSLRPDVEVDVDLVPYPGRPGQSGQPLPVPFRAEQGARLLGGDGIAGSGDGVAGSGDGVPAGGGREGSGS